MTRKTKRQLAQQVGAALAGEPFPVDQLGKVAGLVGVMEQLVDDVELNPVCTLLRWNVLYMKDGSTRFAGVEDLRWHDTGLVSVPIVQLDLQRRCGMSASGRVYRLVGPPLSLREGDAWVVRRIFPSHFELEVVGSMTDPHPRWCELDAFDRPTWEVGDFCHTLLDVADRISRAKEASGTTERPDANPARDTPPDTGA